MPFLREKSILSALVFMLAPSAGFAEPQIVVVNADIFTADPSRPMASALAVEDGIFSAVGDDEEVLALVGPDTRVIDAGGRFATAGFTEAHVHIAHTLPGRPMPMPGMPFPGRSGDETIAAVGKAAETPGDWIVAFIGPQAARDNRNWRDALAAVAPDRPVALRGFWGHISMLNSAALDRIEIKDDVADPIGGWWGRDADGRLDGRVYEAADEIAWGRIAPPDQQNLAAAISEMSDRYARWGVTSIHLMNSFWPLDLVLPALAQSDTPLKWTIYSWAGPLERTSDAWTAVEKAQGGLPDRVRVEGPKWLLDGTGVEQNAFQRVAYRSQPDWRGRSNYTDANLDEILRSALRSRSQLALHVVGDGETDRLLAAMTAMAPSEEWREHRVRIEHGDGLREDTLDTAERMGVVVIQNPTHLPPPNKGGPPPLFDTPSLLASLINAGLPLAFGSDAGPNEANPYLNMMLAVVYQGRPGEALTLEQALLAYTSAGAFAERQENVRGRVVPGMAADLAVLSQDVLSVPPDALPGTVSLLTLVDGEIAFEAEGVFAASR